MLSVVTPGFDSNPTRILKRFKAMWDVLMILATIVFFVIAIACTHACERLR